MKMLTSATKSSTAKLFMLSILFVTYQSLSAIDLIEVVLDDNIDFAANYNTIPPSNVYNQFDFSPHFVPISLFTLSTDFPVNVEEYFEPGSQQVKLELIQSNFQSLKQTKPNHIELTIPVSAGKNFALSLSKNVPVSSDFIFKDIGGNTVSFTEGLHYHGIVNDNTTSWAAVSVFDNYIRAIISDFEGIYILTAINHIEENYLLYNDKKLAIPYYVDLGCSIDDIEIPEELSALRIASNPAKVFKSAKQSIQDTIKIAIESDYQMYLHHNQNLQEVYNYVTATINEAALIFKNEGIPIQLSELTAWNVLDDYDKNNVHEVLQQLGNKRKNDFNGDLVHLFTSEYRDRGGVAHLNGLGKCYTYYADFDWSNGPYGVSVVDHWHCVFGMYHYDVWTFAHELGHNFGSPHTHFPSWEVDGESGKALDNAFDTGTNLFCDHVFSDGCFDSEASLATLEKTGGTIMSYYVATDYGTSLYRGFGEQPGNLIRETITDFFNQGCTDPNACNFDATASIVDGSCFYGNQANDDRIFENYKWLKGKVDVTNCSDESITVYRNTANNKLGVFFRNDGCAEHYLCDGRQVNFSATNIEILQTWTCTDCVGNIKGCRNPSACNYNPDATLNDNSCYFANSNCLINSCNTNCDCQITEEAAITNNDIFSQQPWLAASISYTGICNYEKISSFTDNANTIIVVEYANGTTELYKNEVLICDIRDCYTCIENALDDLNNPTETCWICEPSCSQLGLIYYDICDQGRNYYLIETADGEIIDPYNGPDVNFNYPNGAVVQFSYNEEFPTACELANKGVTIDCIDEVDLPCTNTGTVFFTACNQTTYYLIEMDDGTILDPYNSPSLFFNYVEGDVVEFAYMPLNTVFCDASDIAGRITCIRSIATDRCIETGFVFTQDCNGSETYLIRTTQGSIIKPQLEPGITFNFTNGSVVEFNYSSTFTSTCPNTDFGAQISCIETIELPCTYKGTVFTETCDGETYYLINMGADGILDPYNSPLIDFIYEETDYVQFAFMPIYYSPCTSANLSGIVTCIETTCVNDIQKINSLPIPSGIYNNSKHIISYGEVHDNSNVTFKAPDRITLGIDFKVEAGATFKAVNEACD